MPSKSKSKSRSKKSRSTAYKFSVHVKKPRSAKKSSKRKSSSKKSSKKSSKSSSKSMSWMGAMAKARKELGIKGFVTINRGPEGIKLYKRAKEIYGK
jgi:hypothetical protein